VKITQTSKHKDQILVMGGFGSDSAPKSHEMKMINDRLWEEQIQNDPIGWSRSRYKYSYKNSIE